MRTLRRILAGVCMIALLAAAAGPIGAKASEAGSARAAAGGKVTITSEENRVPTFEAGAAKEWVLIVHNNTNSDLTNAVLAPKLGDTNDEWPFHTEYQSYNKELNIKAGESQKVTFEFTQREDVATVRHTLQFGIYTADSTDPLVSQNFYVNTIGKPEEKTDSPAENPGDQPSDGGMDAPSADAGGFSNGGASGGGSVPRVIVTGFNTDPAEVRAGSNFTLTIHLKNTSKATRVRNMLFDLSAPTEGSDAQTVSPAFLPASGSSTIYLDGIKANGTADISIQLNSKADLLQKPYSVELNMKYEDASGGSVDASSSISIPVKQDARFEFSEFEISPDSISVGDEVNVMCSLYNLGRIKLYNVKAAFEGACIKKEEVFVGNVDSGASASIDAMLEGAQATGGPAKVTMTLSYEDESGKISTAQKELQISVMEETDDGMITDMGEIPEEAKGFPVIPVVVCVAAVAVAAVIVFLSKKRKRRRRMHEEEELLDELDRPSEDE